MYKKIILKLSLLSGPLDSPGRQEERQPPGPRRPQRPGPRQRPRGPRTEAEVGQMFEEKTKYDMYQIWSSLRARAGHLRYFVNFFNNKNFVCQVNLTGSYFRARRYDPFPSSPDIHPQCCRRRMPGRSPRAPRRPSPPRRRRRRPSQGAAPRGRPRRRRRRPG